MAKKQTRRTLSINRAVHDAAKKLCESHAQPLAQFAEDALLIAMAPYLPTDKIAALKALRRGRADEASPKAHEHAA